MDITISDAIDAAWNKDKDVIMKIISSKRLAIPGVMSAACAAGDVSIVELLAEAWKGQPGGAIGGHCMDTVIEKKDYKMFLCIVRNQLLSKVATDTIAMNLGFSIID